MIRSLIAVDVLVVGDEFLYFMSANDENKALDKFFILFEQYLTEKADNDHLNC